MNIKLKRLHIFLLKSFAGPFFLTFFIVLFIMVMQFMFKYINDLIGKGLEFHVISEFLFYLTASMVPMALPLALLMAALMTFGNLGEHYELTALKSSGISLIRIMMPLIIVTLFLSAGAFFFANNMLPVANLKLRSLLYDIQRQRPEFSIDEGVFYNGIEGYSIRIDKRNPKTNMLYQIRIYDHTEHRGNIAITHADSGIMRLSDDNHYLITTLYSGQSYTELETDQKNKPDFTYPHRQDKFTEQSIMMELTGFGLNRTDESLFRSNYSMMSLTQLKHYEDSFKLEIEKISTGLHITLEKTTYYNYRRPTLPMQIQMNDSTQTRFGIYRLDLDSLYQELNERDKAAVINQALNHARASMNFVSTAHTNSDSKIERLRKYQIETQRKFTLSFACFVFFFIGAPLGAIIRKGGLGMPAVISVLFFLAWYIISISGEKFARESFVTPFQGMWMSSLILLLFGSFLTYKAVTDSALMDMETYSIYIRKLRTRIKKAISR